MGSRWRRSTARSTCGRGDGVRDHGSPNLAQVMRNAAGTPWRLAAHTLLWPLALMAGLSVQGQTLPTAAEVMARLLEQAQKNAAQVETNRAPQYYYLLKSKLENLDENDRFTEREEKQIEVEFPSGNHRLLKLLKDGVEQTGAVFEKEAEKEGRISPANKMGKKGGRLTIAFNEELLARYELTLTGRQRVGGRVAYVIFFEPNKQSRPNKPKSDRVLDKVAGKLWIDEEDYALAKLEVYLQEKVRFWGGLFGALNKMTFSLEKVRLADGAWVDRSLSGVFAGQKLFDDFNCRFEQRADPFHPLPGRGQPAGSTP